MKGKQIRTKLLHPIEFTALKIAMNRYHRPIGGHIQTSKLFICVFFTIPHLYRGTKENSISLEFQIALALIVFSCKNFHVKVQTSSETFKRMKFQVYPIRDLKTRKQRSFRLLIKIKSRTAKPLAHNDQL